MKYLKKTQVRKIISNSANKVITVSFTRRTDSKLRTMTGIVNTDKNYEASLKDHGLVQMIDVEEAAKIATKKSSKQPYRSFGIENVIALTVDGKTYTARKSA